MVHTTARHSSSVFVYYVRPGLGSARSTRRDVWYLWIVPEQKTAELFITGVHIDYVPSLKFRKCQEWWANQRILQRVVFDLFLLFEPRDGCWLAFSQLLGEWSDDP